MGSSESPERAAHGGETVAPRGREVPREIERRQRIEIGGGNFGGGCSGEKVAKKHDKATN